MRFLLSLLFIVYPIAVMAQSSPEWSRVYTFDDSTIEMNTALITRVDKDVSRLRFRWTFDTPEVIDGLKYQSQLEVMEFNCAVNRYRTYHLTYFDQAGDIVRIHDSPGQWRTLIAGGMMEKLFVPACELIKGKTRANVQSDESVQLEKVALYAYGFAEQLEQTKDFKILIDRFFASDYLNGYLQDDQTKWFFNLSRDTATKLTRQELERFYVAAMNAGYLTSLYLISQSHAHSASLEKLVPPDVLQLINNHPYTTRYRTGKNNYDFLEDKINDVERARSYTDLLEKIGSLMRAHVKTVKAERNPHWKAVLDDANLFQPKLRVCAGNCLALPKGTKIFDVDVPVFHLQIAEIDGKLKTISAIGRN